MWEALMLGIGAVGGVAATVGVGMMRERRRLLEDKRKKKANAMKAAEKRRVKALAKKDKKAAQQQAGEAKDSTVDSSLGRKNGAATWAG